MKNKVLIIAAIIIAIGSLVFSVFIKGNDEKTAYINISVLYGEFDYKLEMEVKLKNLQANQQNVLDSLKMQMRIASKGAVNENDLSESQLNELKRLQQAYLLKEKQFNEEYSSLSNEYNAQIIKQLNQYVAEYGEENNYDYIFGANNDGSIMYSKESEDITDEVLSYINNKYSGK
ncbi:MAG: hypothetical protein A2281_16480 [Bacteroidetes bacterium RIFOXYA12_FULL_38_20]|nr:MAG: Outer membrane protein [candidate division TM6 bacterium GW2011_GWF2_33_332]OFY78597.1 MAG: hypothetical protein A2281_16480 [Bacteroidetes bacterium RIFOXYA12_FULL_38_20]